MGLKTHWREHRHGFVTLTRHENYFLFYLCARFDEFSDVGPGADGVHSRCRPGRRVFEPHCKNQLAR